MQVSPTSPEATIGHGVRNLIANCATFITETNSADYSAAKCFVHLDEVDTSKIVDRPLAVVFSPRTRYSVKTPGIPGIEEVSFVLEIDEPVGYQDPIDRWTYVANFLGAIPNEISQLADPLKGVTQDADLCVSEVVLVAPFNRVPVGDLESYWQGRYMIRLARR
jgi:hypothetical protein